MEKKKVEQFLFENAQFFPTSSIMDIKARLEEMDDDNYLLLQSLNFKNVNVAMVLAFFAVDRLYLNDLLLGIIKLVVMFMVIGFIWWAIDFFSVTKRVHDYNLRELYRVIRR